MNISTVSIDVVTGCHNWLGEVSTDGYAKYRYGTLAPALYTVLVADIPKGMHLDHVCRNKRCINVKDPKHFEVVTPKENMQRRSAVITHCPRGHEYTPANTYWPPKKNGVGRICKTCQRLWAAKDWRNKHPDCSPELRQNRTHCKRGHPYSGDNLYIRPSNGRRMCKACQRLGGQRYEARIKKKQLQPLA